MYNKELIDLISEYQHHNMENFSSLYGVFEKLLHMYGAKQNDSESAEDLTDFFVELLFRIDLSRFEPDNSESLKRYIAVCIRNEHNLILKKRPVDIPLSQELINILPSTTPSFEDKLFLKDCLSVVTAVQRKILIMRYCYGYSDSEIACLLKTSRQAVCKSRNRGLKAIRRYLDG